MKRAIGGAGALLLVLVALFMGSFVGSFSASTTHAAQVTLTPCPGPSPTPTATPSYGTRPAHTAYHFGAAPGNPIPGAVCGPPPPGPYSSPKICGMKFDGTAAEFSVVTCSPIPPPLCGTRAANALFIGGTDLNLVAPGYEIFAVLNDGTFERVGAITGNGGVYEFVAVGGQPTTLTGTGNCVPIPLPRTGFGAAPASGSAGWSLQWAIVGALAAAAVALLVLAVRRPASRRARIEDFEL